MPKPTLETRKPIDELTPSDLAAFPVWEFALDDECVPGQDETWVRPLEGRAVPSNEHSLSVAASFTTASGQVLTGFLGVTTSEQVEIDQPVLLAGGQYLFVDVGNSEARRQVAGSLGMREDEVFPLAFELQVIIEGEDGVRRGIVA